MLKKQNWETLFSDFIEETKNTPFKRGEHDCALFVANCIEKITGIDLAKDYRGKYKNRKEAYELLASNGFSNMEEITLSNLGEPYSNINFAKRGDIVTVSCPEGIAVAIIDLTGKSALTSGKNGLECYPKAEWLNAWGL